MTETVSGIISLLLILGVVGGLVYWSKRAEHDRSAYVGLFLVFGAPGVLLSVAGLALSVNGYIAGPLVMGIGLAFALPLLRPVRVALARVTPLDPASPIDMSGLAMILAVMAFSALQLTISSEGGESATNVTGSVTISALIINVVTFAAIAYVCVGYRIWRDGQEATTLLGLAWPTLRTALIALALVIPSFIFSMIGSALTVAFQPDVVENLQETMDQMTTGVQNPLGAILLGLSTGVGEELLFRGAIQPRFGIVIASLCWVLLHVQYDFTFVLVGLFGIGILLGLERKYLGTTAAIITHGVYNVAVVLLQTYLS
ncbi:MAG TPA: CPBP family intramembrane glutamic endopeptidase [Thermomicrobiales bacterium]|nr:CPBP family intramembrane glutamic endopeptidase [Thermomicrobiales bacterium]